MKTPQTLEEIRNILTTENRKTWFDVGVAMFNQGCAMPECPKWARKKVMDEMMEFGWCAASSLSRANQHSHPPIDNQQPKTENRE